MKIRLAGVFDGNRYRCYATVENFLANELTSKNRGKWFYAHAGGLADFQFVLEILMKRGYRIKASTSGSSLIIVHVMKGKNSWHFVDSLWLLKDKLRNIGKWIGIEKGNEDESEEFYRDATIPELRKYNEIDCIILFKAIQMFEETLLELGGQLKMTQASCAMELFRRRFLKRDIATSPLANLIAREAYFASRVEVLNRHCEDAWYYDVNSSFPYERCPTTTTIRFSRFAISRFPRFRFPRFQHDSMGGCSSRRGNGRGGSRALILNCWRRQEGRSGAFKNRPHSSHGLIVESMRRRFTTSERTREAL